MTPAHLSDLALRLLLVLPADGVMTTGRAAHLASVPRIPLGRTLRELLRSGMVETAYPIHPRTPLEPIVLRLTDNGRTLRVDAVAAEPPRLGSPQTLVRMGSRQALERATRQSKTNRCGNTPGGRKGAPKSPPQVGTTRLCPQNPNRTDSFEKVPE